MEFSQEAQNAIAYARLLAAGERDDEATLPHLMTAIRAVQEMPDMEEAITGRQSAYAGVLVTRDFVSVLARSIETAIAEEDTMVRCRHLLTAIMKVRNVTEQPAELRDTRVDQWVDHEVTKPFLKTSIYQIGFDSESSGGAQVERGAYLRVTGSTRGTGTSRGRGCSRGK